VTFQPITITVGLPAQPLKPNVRCHHMTKAIATKKYREEARDAAMASCYDQDVREPIREARVDITYYHLTKRYMDRDNILASLKAVFDGFSDAGLWQDDRECFFMPVQREKDADNPRVEIRVSEGGFHDGDLVDQLRKRVHLLESAIIEQAGGMKKAPYSPDPPWDGHPSRDFPEI
jgi:Holliday junction resolvase RusA-like endonuclease